MKTCYCDIITLNQLLNVLINLKKSAIADSNAVLKHPEQISFHPCSPGAGLIYCIEQIFHPWVHFLEVIKMSEPRL